MVDKFKDLPREAQLTLGGLVLFVIFSFFDWQQVSTPIGTYGDSLWHGFGIITALVAVAYLIWEIGRAMDYKVNLGQVTPELTSAGFAVALLVCTVITFLDWSDFRHWPQWIGLLLSIVIAVAAFMRAKAEGVEMPKMPENISVSRTGGSGAAAASTASPPTPPPAAPEPAAPVEEAAGEGESPEA
jgi:hypothetical protein